MARVLSAKERDELAALQELKRPTRPQVARMKTLAPGACTSCEQQASDKEEVQK